MDSDLPPVGPSVEGSIGPMFLGMVVGAMLWGVTCLQTWFYYDNYPTDPKSLRILVAATWLSDTIHQALVIQLVYAYCILGFGDYERAVSVEKAIYAEVVFNGITGFLVQSFLTHRIWSFRRNYFIVIPISLLVLAELAVSLAYVIQGWNLTTFDSLVAIRGLSMSINALAAAGDVAISIAMIFLLNSSKSGFSWSNHIINRLIIFSINSGMMTSLCAVMSLITILAIPGTTVYIGFYFIIGRFYANSLLATLNTRKSLRAQSSGGSGGSRGESYSLGDRNRTNTTNNKLFSRFNPTNDKPAEGITVQIETIHQREQASEVDVDIEAKGAVTPEGTHIEKYNI